jgi:hypothetical protein
MRSVRVSSDTMPAAYNRWRNCADGPVGRDACSTTIAGRGRACEMIRELNGGTAPAGMGHGSNRCDRPAGAHAPIFRDRAPPVEREGRIPANEPSTLGFDARGRSRSVKV